MSLLLLAVAPVPALAGVLQTSIATKLRDLVQSKFLVSFQQFVREN